MKRILRACFVWLAVALAQPALAEEAPKDFFAGLLEELKETPDPDGLKRSVSSYEKQYRRLDAGALANSMAPSMLAQLAREDGVSPEAWRRSSRDAILMIKNQIVVRNFDVIVGDADVLAGSNERRFSVLTACLSASNGPKFGLLSRYSIVAVFENGKWFMVPIDDAAQGERAKRLYPALADQTFEEPVLRRIKIDDPNKLTKSTLCPNPGA